MWPPFYRWGNLSPKILTNLLKVTELQSARARIWIQVCLMAKNRVLSTIAWKEAKQGTQLTKIRVEIHQTSGSTATCPAHGNKGRFLGETIYLLSAFVWISGFYLTLCYSGFWNPSWTISQMSSIPLQIQKWRAETEKDLPLVSKINHYDNEMILSKSRDWEKV